MPYTLLAGALRLLHPPSPAVLERVLEAVRSDLDASVVALVDVVAAAAPRVVGAVGSVGSLAAAHEMLAPGLAREGGRPRRGMVRRADGTTVAWGAPGGRGPSAVLVASRSGPLPESAPLPARLAPPRRAATTSLDLHLRTAELEAELIREALARANGNRSEAARLLGLSRNGLAAKLRRHGLDTG